MLGVSSIQCYREVCWVLVQFSVTGRYAGVSSMQCYREVSWVLVQYSVTGKCAGC